MRSYSEMMSLIKRVAQQDARVRAVILNGSRANPQAKKDMFQDYDIVYVVEDIRSFILDQDWIDVFGERIMLQMPENMREPMGDGRFTYLMLFTDCNRIDLQLIPVEKADQLISRDSQSVLLLDKDNVIVPFPPASNADYYIQKPMELEYASCCNNFWWCMQNVAKGIWRDELAYAMGMYHGVVRDELHHMIDWYIGIQHNFNVSAGKMGKLYKEYLDPIQFHAYRKTYSGADFEDMWKAIFIMCELFHDLAQDVAQKLGFQYNHRDAAAMLDYLKHVEKMPTANYDFEDFWSVV